MFWRHGQDFLTDKKDIIVWVASYNEKAISFYEKLGFVKTDKDLSAQTYEISPGKYIPETEMVLKRN
jgi:ribosomal protein S18 acetylase RimI-like enzyme